MKLALQRLVLTPQSTCGNLYVNDALECWTLELPVVNGLPGSAIPAGTYPVVLAPSPRFLALTGDAWVQQYAGAMPHIQPIPGRSLIMIHWGNYPSNTDGCVLVGKSHQSDSIGESRQAFSELYPLIKSAINSGEGVTIEVVDHPNGS
jgi:Family of unknown function (DUF5675)